MDARRTGGLVIITAILAALPIAAAANEPRDRADVTSAPNNPETTLSTPWISSKVPTPVRSKIEASFHVASQRLVESPPCRDLFADLGADGLETLSSTLFYPASAAHEKRLCGGAWGYTTVGAAPTFLCRKFSRLSDQRGAMILIHEALHHAGMDEWPNDSTGLTSKAINSLVEDACGL